MALSNVYLKWQNRGIIHGHGTNVGDWYVYNATIDKVEAIYSEAPLCPFATSLQYKETLLSQSSDMNNGLEEYNSNNSIIFIESSSEFTYI